MIHESVSCEHADFWRQSGKLLVRDFGSRNETPIPGISVHKMEVKIGDVVHAW